jgi:hypothetical protein
MGDGMRTLAYIDSEMVLLREILAGILPDILAGLGASLAVPHDVLRHLTALVATGGFIHTPVVIPTHPTMG